MPCPLRLVEGVGYPESEVVDGCESAEMGIGTQIWPSARAAQARYHISLYSLIIVKNSL